MPWEAVRLQTAYLQCSLALVHFGPPTPLGSRLKSLHDRRRRRCWDARKLHQHYFSRFIPSPFMSQVLPSLSRHLFRARAFRILLANSLCSFVMQGHQASGPSESGRECRRTSTLRWQDTLGSCMQGQEKPKGRMRSWTDDSRRSKSRQHTILS